MSAALERARAFAAEERPLDPETAVGLFALPDDALPQLFALADEARRRASGNRVRLCGIYSAKSGLCPEDCSFCAQSAHHASEPPVHELQGADRIAAAGKTAQEAGATEFSIVTSGFAPSSDELREVGRAVEQLASGGVGSICASLGVLDSAELAFLKSKGLRHYHHNLETSRSFFPQVCSTHNYDRDLEVVRSAKELGLEVCCGGIFGLGESGEQRVELAVTLRELEVGCVPINFLHPRPGTPMADREPLRPLEALRIIAVFRLLLPQADLVVCGGREAVLRDLQSWVFLAGANGILLGDYLTTAGRAAESDLRMLSDLGLEAAGEVAVSHRLPAGQRRRSPPPEPQPSGPTPSERS